MIPLATSSPMIGDDTFGGEGSGAPGMFPLLLLRPVPCLAIAQAVQPGIPVVDSGRDVVCSGMPAPDPRIGGLVVHLKHLEVNTASSGPGGRTSNWRVQWRDGFRAALAVQLMCCPWKSLLEIRSQRANPGWPIRVRRDLAAEGRGSQRGSTTSRGLTLLGLRGGVIINIS